MTPDELVQYLSADFICHSKFFKNVFSHKTFEYIQEEVDDSDIVRYYNEALGSIYVEDKGLFIPQGSFFCESYSIQDYQPDEGKLISIVIVDSVPPAKTT